MEVGYIQPDLAAKVLELDRKPDMSDASDMSAMGRIYLTWNWWQGSRTRSEAGYVWYIRYVRSRSDISDLKLVLSFWTRPKAGYVGCIGYIRHVLDISDLEPVPRFWNLMPISETNAKVLEPDGNIRPSRIYPMKKSWPNLLYCQFWRSTQLQFMILLKWASTLCY
jgi:hypothetical protein